MKVTPDVFSPNMPYPASDIGHIQRDYFLWCRSVSHKAALCAAQYDALRQ